MARIATFKGYQGEPPVARPAANVVTAADGKPVKYPGCEGIGVRVVHPSNPRAPGDETLEILICTSPPNP